MKEKSRVMNVEKPSFENINNQAKERDKEQKGESEDISEKKFKGDSLKEGIKEDKKLEERRLAEVRQKIKELPSENQLEPLKSNNDLKTEKVQIDNQEYTVEYVPKEKIYPSFGYAVGNSAKVREDLSPRVKRFVKAHELYHCRDKATWGGWIGREIRANIIPGLKDPLGLLATIKASLTKDRINLYLQRFKHGG